MMEILLVVLTFFSGIVTVVGIAAACKGGVERMAVFGYFSIVLFSVFFSFCGWAVSSKEDYQECIIKDYCNGIIEVDTVAVTNDGMLYEIKIRRK